MAFIYRADKDPNLFGISSSQVGPGEYLDKLPKFSPRQNIEPFLSSSDKLPDQINENPGPGTYYKDTQKLNNLRNLEKSEHNRNIDLVVARVKKDIITLRPAEKLGFDTKAKRFNFDSSNSPNNDFNKTPGPGQYFPSILNKVENNKNKKFKLDKAKISLLKIKYKIPMEQKSFSTVVIESDTNKLNNKLRKTFQYDNFACRPKLFNIRKYKEIMENNDNNSLSSTNYSDQKNRTKFNQFMRTYDMAGFYNFKDMNNLYNNDNSEGKKDIYEYYKSKDSENKNAMKFRINFCKKLNRKKLKKKFEDDIDKLLEGKTPGPGYYFDDIINLEPHSKKLNNTHTQKFGTKVKRFNMLKKPWTDLGPGQYIKINMEKLSKNNKNKDNPSNIDIPFGSKEKRNNTFLCLEKTIDNPGPGNYEFKPFTGELDKEENYIIDSQFGFTGERFNDKYLMRDKYNSPGPGYYKQKINSISYNNKKYKNKSEKMLLNPSNQDNKINEDRLKIKKNKFLNGKFYSLDEFKFRENVPPVGYYFPEYFSTIEYKNRINLMNAKSPEICFNKGLTKTLKKSDSAPNIVGPGYYNINREMKENYYSNNNVHPPFYSSAQKKSFPIKKKTQKVDLEEIGKFYMKEYFKWNKKSFNVLFV